MKFIIYDSECGFCNFWIDLIIKLDKNKIYQFVPLKSDKAKSLLGNSNLDSTCIDSAILFDDEKLFTKSDAVLKILFESSSAGKIFYPLIFIPRSLRDFIYDLVARNRYKLFGKKSACRIPFNREEQKTSAVKI